MRLVAAERLSDVLKGAPFAPFSSSEIEDSRDRALANRLVTTALRRHGQIDVMVARYLERGIPRKSGPFEALLRLALAHLVFLPELGDHSAIFLAVEAAKRDTRSQHVAKLMNAVLRRAQLELHSLRHLPHEALFPAEYGTRWRDAWGEDAVEEMAEALIEGAPLDLTLRDDNGELIDALGAVRVLADSVRVNLRDKPVDALAGYAEGRWWVQDVAAAIPARLLTAPAGARVLDLCAAPGGKTAQLVKAGYRVTALDADGERMERLADNLERLGYHAEQVVADGLTYRPEAGFEGVLLDAPCSATGTFRRHPEVLWHRDRAAVAGRVALQRRFLAAAANCLNPGGVLVYCVCSLEVDEGEAQAAWVDQNLGLLVRDPIRPEELAELAAAVTADGTVRTRPGMPVPGAAGGTLDGFFVARFRRRQESPAAP